MKKRTVVIAVVVLIGITACVTGVLIRSEAQKRARYEQAMRLADAGDTGGAYVLFAQLGNYRDAALQAERMIEQDVLLPCRAAEKGDTVTFGRYEQDNNPGNGPEPIDWIVLDKVDGKLPLLSSACLAGKAYNAESFEPVTWETCSLRAWLGGEFFDSAFSEREREAVASVVNRNDDHSTVGTPGGKDTEDRVFLLSESDAVIYLNNDYDQDTIGRAMASDYAVANGLQTDEDGLCSWWLRSPGMYEYIAQFVDQQGKDHMRRPRDVWMINTKPYRGAHFATFPEELAQRCILAGCPEDGLVLDPFMGSGTTAVAAQRLNRHFVGIELNSEYIRLALDRIEKEID